MNLRLFNTLGRAKEDFKISGKQVKMYTCGPTVYNYPHVGNLRSILFADTLYRWLVYGEEFPTKWIMNITDVDDKTIRDSRRDFPDLDPMVALRKFTRKYEDIFFDNLQSLHIDKTEFAANPRATEYIDHMRDLITAIYDRGYAKIIEGSVFFDLVKYSADFPYGVLLNLKLDSLQSGSRTLADETTKDNIQDFALWKAVKEGEPFWDFQLNGYSLPGRPGWHIECSAMSKDLLDLPFDIHTGGVDLIFPHHEDEIAQARAGHDVLTARFWVHNEHLMVNGQKMAKSLGNFFTLQDLLDKGFTADEIRFFLVTNHYRAKLNLTDEALQASANALSKIKNICGILSKNIANDSKSADEKLNNFKERFFDAMRDDLNTPVAIAVFHDFLNQYQAHSDLFTTHCLDFIHFVSKIFGVSLMISDYIIPDDILTLGSSRQEAKINHDFTEADKIRELIISRGYEIRDVSNGFEIYPLQK